MSDNYSTQLPSGVIRGFDIYSGQLSGRSMPAIRIANEMPVGRRHSPRLAEFLGDLRRREARPGLCADGPRRPGHLGRQPPPRRGAIRQCGGRARHRDRQAALVVPERASRSVGHGHAVAAQPARSCHGAMHGARDLRAGQDRQHLRARPARRPAIVPAPETPVPQGSVAGRPRCRRPSPSRPSFRPPKLTETKMWGATMFDQLACRIMFHWLRYEGTFTPPSMQARSSSRATSACSNGAALRSIPAPDRHRQSDVDALRPRLMPRGPDNPPRAERRIRPARKSACSRCTARPSA